MLALSIKQPWAWAILYAGKDVENRTWKTNFRGPLLIHSGLTFDFKGLHWLVKNQKHLRLPAIPQAQDFPRGGIVGGVDLVDTSNRHPSPWFFGPTGFILKDPRPCHLLETPGRLGMFKVPESICSKIEWIN